MMTDSIKCESVKTSSTPEIIEHIDSISNASGKEQLIAEIIELKRTIENLTERREEDRKSILILQSQIDRMRGAECTDSLESSFKIVSNVASYVWTKVPSVPISSILSSITNGGKKKSKKKSSSHSSSATGSVKSKKLPNAVFKTSTYITKE